MITPKLDKHEVIIQNATIKDEKETFETLSIKKVEWSNENESILVEWGDIAACNKWLHMESCRLFTKKNAYFTIPIIVISTITGTLSFIAAGFKKQQTSSYLQMGVGASNIIVGIISTIHQFLNIAELKEMHRVSYISWDKLHRNIRVELAKTPSERTDANHFIKLCRQEYDRLTEISPIISPNIIYLFFKIFSGEEGSEQRKRFELLKKPDICNCLTSLDESRLKWFEFNKRRKSINSVNNSNNLVEQIYNDNYIDYEIQCPSPVPNFNQYGSRRPSKQLTRDKSKFKNLFFEKYKNGIINNNISPVITPHSTPPETPRTNEILKNSVVYENDDTNLKKKKIYNNNEIDFNNQRERTIQIETEFNNKDNNV